MELPSHMVGVCLGLETSGEQFSTVVAPAPAPRPRRLFTGVVDVPHPRWQLRHTLRLALAVLGSVQGRWACPVLNFTSSSSSRLLLWSPRYDHRKQACALNTMPSLCPARSDEP